VRVVIAGGGRVGRSVAASLAEAGDDVSIVDRDAAVESEFGSTFDGTFHVGEAYDVDVLEEAGIRDAVVFLALTSSDNANLMAVQVAENVFGVPKAIARLGDPERADVYRTLGVDYVTGTQLVANVVVERVHEADFAYHLSFAAGSIQIVEMTVGPRGDGLSAEELEVAGHLRIAAVQRAGRVFIPDDATPLAEGDIVVAAARRGVLSRVRRYLEGTSARRR
jgi:trk system potassium uptake protein TrkA